MLKTHANKFTHQIIVQCRGVLQSAAVPRVSSHVNSNQNWSLALTLDRISTLFIARDMSGRREARRTPCSKDLNQSSQRTETVSPALNRDSVHVTFPLTYLDILKTKNF